MVVNHLQIKNLTVSVANNQILKNVNIYAETGDIFGIVGPNGAGKSTLLKTIMHHYTVDIKSGRICFNQKSLNKLFTNQIADLGFFYVSQNPIELDGVGMIDFLKLIYTKQHNQYSFSDMYFKTNEHMKQWNLPEELLTHDINVGFSGGQKKKSEIVQMSFFNPKVLLLDEIDSGLDVDTTKKLVEQILRDRKKYITIVISHQTDFLQMLKPNKVLVLVKGRIVKTGGASLICEINTKGFKPFMKLEKSDDFVKEDPYRVCRK
ncbi:MAG: Fe-S cluster assembly ATPase SufC [Mycoplasmataceae bacterium]|jgi:Fe-S cluster assembly ATP-binding protein|nr:Fe-S cluster assembly ATPase SufC [Mycoplasmataceae bacterium]